MTEAAAGAQFAWAGRVAAESAGTLGIIRLVRGLEAAQVESAIWVRGPQSGGETEVALAQVPWQARYELLEGRELRRAGHFLPDGSLPSAKWLPLPQFLTARMPAPVQPGTPPAGVPIELRPDAAWREPNLIEADAREWLAWVETAPEVRLARLSFAFNTLAPERVFVRGTPLPPLAGARFVEADGVATPAGTWWWPEVSPATLRAALGAEKAELALLSAAGAWLRIPRSAWIAATRSAVRALLGGGPP